MVLWAWLAACREDPPAPAAGLGIFEEGCPEGGALARVIGVDARLDGMDAVGSLGDLLIANDHAAYVITAPLTQKTYYTYGGVIADAVPMSGCTPVTEDKLDEVGLVLGQLDLTDPEASILRGFRGDEAAVVNDGSLGGDAQLRVTGADDMYWLVEYELVKAKVDDGGRPLSEPFGLELQIDYTLSPDSPVLQVDLTAKNPTDTDLPVFWGSLLSFGDTLDVYAFASDAIDIAGLTLDLGVPWMVATDGDGAWAYAVDGGNLASTNIGGIDVAVDATAALSANVPAGSTSSQRFFFSVGATDGQSATTPLASVNPEPLPDQAMTLTMVAGRAVDAAGAPVGGARIVLEADAGSGAGALDEVVSRDDGTFDVALPVFDAPWSYRLIGEAEGRDLTEPVDVAPGGSEVVVSFGPASSLDYVLEDGDGGPSPARVVLERDDGARIDLWIAGTGQAPVPPGTWHATVTRGYEFVPVRSDVVLPADGSGTLQAVLERVVDTTGFLSVDTHVHTSYSPDSDIRATSQLQHAAAHGLEIVVHTEHEVIVDQMAHPAEAGVDAWVTSVGGEEVTAVVPEHMTMFPAYPDGGARGGMVPWYGLDLDTLFATMYERSGGGINLINHPGYLDLIQWDRVAAAPGLTDATLLGWPAGTPLWSWAFDGIEVMNGHSSPFTDGNGRFDNWLSMVNAGYRVVAVGCSDDHGGDEVGFPRTYVPSPTDDPAAFTEDTLVAAFLEGGLVISAGAFARVDANGAGPGGLAATSGTVDLGVRVEAIPEIDVTHVVVFSSCDEVMRIDADDSGGVVKLDTTLVLSVPVDGDSTIVVAGFGANVLPIGMPQYDPTHVPRFLTNPIYVDGDGDGAFTAPGGRECAYFL